MVLATSNVKDAPFRQGVIFAHVFTFAGSFGWGLNPLTRTVPVGTLVRLQLSYSLKNF